MKNSKTITVFGSGSCPPSWAQYATAEAVGAELAKLGCTVATGAYGGVMEAAAKGAKEAGGKTFGFTMLGRPQNQFISDTVDCQYYNDEKGVDSPPGQFGRQLGYLENSAGFVVIAGGGIGTVIQTLVFINLASKGVTKGKSMAILVVDGDGEKWVSDLFYLVKTLMGLSCSVSLVNDKSTLTFGETTILATKSLQAAVGWAVRT